MGRLGKSLPPKTNHMKSISASQKKNYSLTNQYIIGKTDSINNLVFSFYSDLSLPGGMSSVKMCG